MNLKQLAILETLCGPLFGRERLAHCDLNRDEMNAILAAIHGMPNPRLVQALQAVLLFYYAGAWTSDKRLEWNNLTEHAACTTRGLCDFIRRRLEEPYSPYVERLVKQLSHPASGEQGDVK